MFHQVIDVSVTHLKAPGRRAFRAPASASPQITCGMARPASALSLSLFASARCPSKFLCSHTFDDIVWRRKETRVGRVNWAHTSTVPNFAQAIEGVPNPLRPHSDLIRRHRVMRAEHCGSHRRGNQPITGSEQEFDERAVWWAFQDLRFPAAVSSGYHPVLISDRLPDAFSETRIFPSRGGSFRPVVQSCRRWNSFIL